MSTTIEPIEVPNEKFDESQSTSKASTDKKPKKGKNPIDLVLDFLSSVKVGVSLLAIMIVATAIGTFIIQKGTSGFREYFQQLLPAEKTLYTSLGFLDIYHTWWFNLLLLTVSLNIILASIDYFPAAWRYVTHPVLKISAAFVNRQPLKETVVLPASAISVDKARVALTELLCPAWAIGGLKKLSSFRLRVTEDPKSKAVTIFADRGVWNRLMAYAVHISLLTIFSGAFIGGMFGHKGVVRLAPGDVEDKFVVQSPDPNIQDEFFQMPFSLKCTDIQQDLLDPKKMDLSAPNTLDWHTRLLVRYKNQEYPAHIHLNTPFDFRGYRFFQASFDNVGSAREVTLAFEPTAGGTPREVKVNRQGIALPGLGTLRLAGFYPDFTMNGGTPGTASGDYVNSVAELEWVPEGSNEAQRLWAFMADKIEMVTKAPVVASKTLLGKDRLILKDFEKVSQAHVLQVQFDPGVNAVYIGCAMLILCLWLVFFFSHQRIWVLLEPDTEGNYRVSVTGNTNRNRIVFEKKFNVLVNYLTGKSAALTSEEEIEN